MTVDSEEPSLRPVLFSSGPVSGPVILCLHGVGRFSEDYQLLVKEFSSHMRVITLDFRGHGASPRALNGYYVVNYISDVVNLLETSFSQPVTIYGHSLGAMVALAAAAKLPAKVNAIILEDPPFQTMGQRINQTPWHSLFEGMKKVAELSGDISDKAEALGEISFPSYNGKGNCKLRDIRSRSALEFGAKCISKVDPAVFDPIIKGRWLDNYDQNELYKQVLCPALLFQGDPDSGGALMDEDADRAEKELTHCHRLRFPGTGHLIRSEKPQEVFQAVKDFIQTILPQSDFGQPFAPAASNEISPLPTT